MLIRSIRSAYDAGDQGKRAIKVIRGIRIRFAIEVSPGLALTSIVYAPGGTGSRT
jgi:hypothetical protein